LPIPQVNAQGVMEMLVERQPYLLFDRMVAFHIQRGLAVPLSAPEFYQGLRQRFLESDGMVFTPLQRAEYDKRRMQAEGVAQLALFVNDERSAIQWLQRELATEDGAGPQTYQELQPKFLRELHLARHEELPELRDLLEQNFLQDEATRWYVPDPERQEDLERLRLKNLLREFAAYQHGRGRLRTFPHRGDPRRVQRRLETPRLCGHRPGGGPPAGAGHRRGRQSVDVRRQCSGCALGRSRSSRRYFRQQTW
jgi:hypothetical protein